MPLAPSESEAIRRRVDSALSTDLPDIPWRCRTEISDTAPWRPGPDTAFGVPLAAENGTAIHRSGCGE